jgi:hypothetical protein
MGKVKIFLLQPREVGYALVGKRSVDEKKQTFRMNKRDYRLYSKAFIQGYKWWPLCFPAKWCFYDIDAAEPIYFKSDSKKSSKDFKNFMESEGLSKLVSGEQNKRYLLIILGMAVLVMLVGGWGIYNMNQANTKIAELALRIANMTQGGVIILP